MIDLVERIKKLGVGKSLYLDTTTEREAALRIAKVLGVVLATKKSKKKPGFNCTRMPE